MQRERVRSGMRVQILHRTKYGPGRWLAPAEVLSVTHPYDGTPNIRICFLDGSGEIFNRVDPADLDDE